MNELKSSLENAAPAAKVALRKKAPFFCRALSVDGKTPIHFTQALTESDGNLCPMHEAEAKARSAKAHAPIHPVATPVIDESANWRPSGRTGAIWPI